MFHHVDRRLALFLFALIFSASLSACSAPSQPSRGDNFELDVRDADIHAAEALDLQGAAAVVSDADARRGYAFRFRRSGDELRWNLDGVKAGTYRIKVSARADLYLGAPKLSLKLGDKRVRKTFEDESYSSLSYGTFELEPAQKLTLRFENDRWGGSSDKDRNITVDHVSFERVGTTAPEPAEPTDKPKPDEPTPGFEQHQARSAYSFVDSVGVNTHLHYTDTVYGKFDSLIKPKLAALGVKHVRDGVYTYKAAKRDSFYYRRMRELGVNATLITDFGDDYSKLDDVYDWLDGRVAGFEGVNEPDLSGRSDWVAQTKASQKALYNAVNADAATKHVPVLGPSVVWSMSKVGDLSSYMDYGNAHPYPGGRMPAWSAYGNSQKRTLERAGILSADKPVMATEAGYHNALNTTDTHPATSERSAAAYTPRLLLEHFELGVPRTFLYELIDLRADSSRSKRDRHFGLLRNDGSEKPSYRALKNLLGILAEDKNHKPGSLSYNVTGSKDLNSVLLQKGDGTFYLALWRSVSNFDTKARRDLSVSAEKVRVQLAKKPSSLTLHSFNTDGNISSSVKTGTDLGLELKDRLLIVEIRP